MDSNRFINNLLNIHLITLFKRRKLIFTMSSSDLDPHLVSDSRGDAQESDLFADFRHLDSLDKIDDDSSDHQQSNIKGNDDNRSEITSDVTDDEKDKSIDLFTEFCYLGEINVKPPVSKLYSILSRHSRDCVGLPGNVDTNFDIF